MAEHAAFDTGQCCLREGAHFDVAVAQVLAHDESGIHVDARLLLRSVMSSVCKTTLRSVRGAVAPVSVCTAKAPNGLQMPHDTVFPWKPRAAEKHTGCNGQLEL